MSFIPPFSSDDLSEPTESRESSKQPKISVLNQFTHQFLYVLRPIGLYQHIGRFRTRSKVTQVTIRSHFDDRLAKDWQRLAKERQPLSLLLCEVDHFSQFRRRHGDRACNHYLGQVVKVIYANIERPKDTLARYHGDTFAVLLPHTSIDEAAWIAKKIRLRTKALKVDHQSSQAPSEQDITLSLGISTIVPTSKLAPANLIAAAEQSLRQAQTAGGNREVLQEGGR